MEVPQIFLCESNESLLHIFGNENLTQVRTGDTCTTRGATGYVLGVGETEQTFSCQPDGVVSGTQPVCALVSDLALKVGSEYGVDVCIDSADERRCVVSGTSGCSNEEGTAGWPGMTNDSWMDGSIPMCEPQACADLSLGSSVVLDCLGTLHSHTGTVSGPSGYVASDLYDTVFQCLAPPGKSDGTLPRCVLLVGIGQEFDGLEDVAHNCDGVGLGDHCGEEGAAGVAGTYPCAPPSG